MTSAMLRPTEPPMRKVGSAGVNATLAAASGVCVQSSTDPVETEVRFSWNWRLSTTNFTASTPWRRETPSEDSKPVYLRTVGSTE